MPITSSSAARNKEPLLGTEKGGGEIPSVRCKGGSGV